MWQWAADHPTLCLVILSLMFLVVGPVLAEGGSAVVAFIREAADYGISQVFQRRKEARQRRKHATALVQRVRAIAKFERIELSWIETGGRSSIPAGGGEAQWESGSPSGHTYYPTHGVYLGSRVRQPQSRTEKVYLLSDGRLIGIVRGYERQFKEANYGNLSMTSTVRELELSGGEDDKSVINALESIVSANAKGRAGQSK